MSTLLQNGLFKLALVFVISWLGLFTVFVTFSAFLRSPEFEHPVSIIPNGVVEQRVVPLPALQSYPLSPINQNILSTTTFPYLTLTFDTTPSRLSQALPRRVQSSTSRSPPDTSRPGRHLEFAQQVRYYSTIWSTDAHGVAPASKFSPGLARRARTMRLSTSRSMHLSTPETNSARSSESTTLGPSNLRPLCTQAPSVAPSHSNARLQYFSSRFCSKTICAMLEWLVYSSCGCAQFYRLCDPDNHDRPLDGSQERGRG